ncbi:host cell division inhibitory peptide Kil [Klebsiella pasteurii]|uniref:host cell division inhibitory peptide Kil n=1 Tax=Klebsiella pasteurii TaxID=2587529 RepID=UPI0035CFBB79
MASLPKRNPQVQAAQSKLAIAQFIGNGVMWAQAMASMRLIYEAPWHIEGRGLYGFSSPYRNIKIEDIEFNNEMNGDFIYANADLHKMKYEVNTEVSF